MCTEKMHIKVRCIKYSETNNKIKVALIKPTVVSSFGCFVFEIYRGLPFRDLGVFVFEF